MSAVDVQDLAERVAQLERVWAMLAESRAEVEHLTTDRDNLKAWFDASGRLRMRDLARIKRLEAALGDLLAAWADNGTVRSKAAYNAACAILTSGDHISQRLLDNPPPGENEAAERNLARFLEEPGHGYHEAGDYP